MRSDNVMIYVRIHEMVVIRMKSSFSRVYFHTHVPVAKKHYKRLKMVFEYSQMDFKQRISLQFTEKASKGRERDLIVNVQVFEKLCG